MSIKYAIVKWLFMNFVILSKSIFYSDLVFCVVFYLLLFVIFGFLFYFRWLLII
nr:hypothetical protein PB20LOC_04139 [Pectobacterium parmentieri]